MTPASNRLYFGDNLSVLREHVPDEAVDLVYLDPPFKSDADYNVLFKTKSGDDSPEQIRAFTDTWRWDQAAAEAFDEVVLGSAWAPRQDRPARTLDALRSVLGECDMLAYLAFMTVRLAELHRVLKPAGSIYLHCDPTASHYLKVLMDAVFGPENYRNEISWRRTNARTVETKWPRVHDTILFYSKSASYRFQAPRVPGDPGKIPHTLITGPDGKKYNTSELTGAGTTAGETGTPWRGYDPTSIGRHWGNLHAFMDDLDQRGFIHWPKNGGWPRRRAEKPFEPSARMVPVGDVWTDIDRLNQSAKERLGYPTQKPVALLERIISASSNPGDVVLDPFCGCGTAVDAAQKLGRRWIGIDVTHIAISLIRNRLVEAYGAAARFSVLGQPQSVEAARALAEEDRHEFEYWALSLVDARPASGQRKKGADGGIDGRVFFRDEPRGRTKQAVVSVKSGRNVSVKDVRDLHSAMVRERAQIAALVTLEPPTASMRREAASVAGYASPDGRRYPGLQVLTIEDLLDRNARLEHPRLGAAETYRATPRQVREARTGSLFGPE